MKQAQNKWFRFTTEDRALLEASYQKGVENIRKEAVILSKIMGYEEGRIRNWFYERKQKAKHTSVKNQYNIADRCKKEPETVYRVASCTNNEHTQTQTLNAKAKNLNTTIQLTNHPFGTTIAQHKTLDVDYTKEKALMVAYQENKIPSEKSLQQLAQYLDIDLGSIKDWFQKVTASEEEGIPWSLFFSKPNKDVF